MASLLTQQQLVEPAPARRLVVPAGHRAHWGVDPSTRGVSLSSVVRRSDGQLDRWVGSAVFGAGEGAPRLSEIRRSTTRFLEDLLPCQNWPGVVWVEQPGGSQRNWPLFYAVGVIIEAFHSALLDTGHSVRIETVVPASWKKTACGRGDLYKPSKAKGRTGEYGVLTWARENGYAGASWDEADAMGIAEAARRTVALEER